MAFLSVENATAIPKIGGSSSLFRAQFAISDFDGDHRPDLASVRLGQDGTRDVHYLIDFFLTTGLPQSIGITAPTGGLQLTSRDVNGDSYPDVIVTTYWTNQPIAVLLNDGLGNFTRSSPAAFPAALLTSEAARLDKPAAIKDAIAALFSRYLSGECEDREGAPSPQIEAERPLTNTIHLAALSKSHSFFGRAPPSRALYR